MRPFKCYVPINWTSSRCAESRVLSRYHVTRFILIGNLKQEFKENKIILINAYTQYICYRTCSWLIFFFFLHVLNRLNNAVPVVHNVVELFWLFWFSFWQTNITAVDPQMSVEYAIYESYGITVSLNLWLWIKIRTSYLLKCP